MIPNDSFGHFVRPSLRDLMIDPLTFFIRVTGTQERAIAVANDIRMICVNQVSAVNQIADILHLLSWQSNLNPHST